MIRIFTLIFCCFFFVISNANDGKKTPSTIKNVTVYREGAQINRTAIVNLVKGKNVIKLYDLSPNIRENSIQLSGLKNTSVLSINYSKNYLEKRKVSKEISLLEIELKQKLKSKNEIINLINGLNHEQKLLENNQKIKSDNSELSLNKIIEISTYYRKRISSIQNEIYNANRRKSNIEAKITDLKLQKSKLSGNSKTYRGEIIIKLDSDILISLNMKINYLVDNAGWFPLYDIKSKNINSPLNFSYKANIFQQTGSNWDNVNLTLSTGNPNTNSIKPKLDSKYLNFTYVNSRARHAKRRSNYIYNPSMANIQLEVDEQELEEEEVVATYGIKKSSSYRTEKQEAKIDYNETIEIKEENLTATLFKIKKKYSILSDQEITIIQIDNFDIKATYEYYAAPVLDQNVYLTAKLTNWEQFDLLAGEANIYYNGTYIGQTYIDTSVNTKEFTVSLGIDPSVVIKRKQLNNFKSTSLIGATKIVNRGYNINIKNGKRSSVDLILEDRIPISQNKEIKLDKIEVNDADYNKKTGMLQWKLTLKSLETIEKEFSYQVKYPKRKRINL